MNYSQTQTSNYVDNILRLTSCVPNTEHVILIPVANLLLRLCVGKDFMMGYASQYMGHDVIYHETL